MDGCQRIDTRDYGVPFVLYSLITPTYLTDVTWNEDCPPPHPPRPLGYGVHTSHKTQSSQQLIAP